MTPPTFRNDGKRAPVAGASAGIERAAAVVLGEAGAEVTGSALMIDGGWTAQ